MFSSKAVYSKKDNIIELFDNVKVIRNNEIIIGDYAKINTLNESYKLIILGDGPLIQEMKKFSSSYEIKSIFTGYLDKYEISKYYSISNLFIMPSEYDPSPKALNEAMNFKLPVIVSKGLGTCEDLVDEDKNGYIIDVGDILSLSKKINLLNNNRNKLIEFGDYSFDKVSSWNFEEDVKSIIQAANYVTKET